ncbi:hypothetical protein [Methanimicrococcus blatticola]|uniref:hypothetical protein n=1 Tax=Methanimicrococcus blatticola TaxID=91560 RepID=UPI00105E9415|nr:hypothetical protein [Methanimicrococcus blatticola]MBZ3936204.1 hypothetical protein [Methanimicrococcus blatticola]MCC2508447.1 hypothetical protein [Methanimicrococcus blatticola]
MKLTTILMVAVTAILMMSVPALAAGDFSGGDGSMGNPYQIGTPDQLQKIGEIEYLNSHFILINDIDFSGWDKDWVPIGFEDVDSDYDAETYFVGTFDGKGHTISNMAISGTDNVGIFGLVGNATFFNLQLDNISAEGENYVGILAGQTAKDTNLFVMNVSAKNSKINATGDYAGLFGGISQAEFVNIYLYNLEVSGLNNVGALTGGDFDRCSGISLTNCTLENSYIQAEDGGSNIGGSNIGGFIGSFESAEIINSAVKNTQIAANSANNVGGFAGSLYDATLLKSNIGEESKITANDNAGGLIGYAEYGNFSICYADCDIEAEIGVGGLAGVLGDYSIILESFTEGEITGKESVGGLVGSIGNDVAAGF